MSNGIVRICGQYNVNPEGSTPTCVTVGETWRPYWRLPKQREQDIEQAMPIARQIRPYLQKSDVKSNGAAWVSTVAKHMVDHKGWSVAYLDDGDISERVLAFSFISRLRPNPVERVTGQRTYYALRQFGVTATHDLREPAPRGDIHNGNYLKAAAALLHHTVRSLHSDSALYVLGYGQDTRRGYFFHAAGFRQMNDGPTWQQGGALMIASAGHIRHRLEAIPQFAFLQRSVQLG